MLKVTDVEYMGDYSLLCQFSDGKKKYVNLEPTRIHSPVTNSTIVKIPHVCRTKRQKSIYPVWLRRHHFLGERSRHCSRVPL